MGAHSNMRFGFLGVLVFPIGLMFIEVAVLSWCVCERDGETERGFVCVVGVVMLVWGRGGTTAKRRARMQRKRYSGADERARLTEADKEEMLQGASLGWAASPRASLLLGQLVCCACI